MAGDSPRLLEALERRRRDLGQAGGGLQARELGRVEPVGLAELLVQDRLARLPARGKAQNDEKAPDAILRIAGDGFAGSRQAPPGRWPCWSPPGPRARPPP